MATDDDGTTSARRAGRVAVVVLSVLLWGCTTTSTGTSGSPSAPDTTAASGADSSAAARLLARVCDRTAAVDDLGTVQSPALGEISGIVASSRQDGAWWVHNDSGTSPQIVAVDDAGATTTTVDLEGATATDWEAIALAPGPAGGPARLFVGDIGDNAARPGSGATARSSILVHRFAEPSPDGPPSAVAVEALELRYPDGPNDAEALLVDPVRGDLVIVTKDWSISGRAKVYRAPADLSAGSSTVLELASTLDLPVGSLVTGADVSPDGQVVALRTYGDVLLYVRPPGEPLWAAFGSAPCPGPPVVERQGEAIAFSRDGTSYVTVSEGTNPTLHLTR